MVRPSADHDGVLARQQLTCRLPVPSLRITHICQEHMYAIHDPSGENLGLYGQSLPIPSRGTATRWSLSSEASAVINPSGLPRTTRARG